jgi:predicted signal transduction protein with EAL and GGDEF domain
MRTGTGLTVVAIGAILAFAVTSSPSFFNIHIAGWVIMLAGVAGMVLSRRRDYSQLLRWFRPRARVVEHNPGPRALGPGQVFQLPPDAGAPLAEARPSAGEATADRTIEGTVEHVEETANDHSQE